MKSDMIKAYFMAWSDNDITVLANTFSSDIIYSECYGPEYHGLDQLIQWFDDWNKRGRVLAWDINRIMECGDTAIVQWHFKCSYDGNTTEFDGVTVAEFNDDNKICRLSEYQSKSEHYYPYDAAESKGEEPAVTMKSTPQEKIALFRSLFKGREDVYVLRWHNTKTGKSGYSPVCANKWAPGICGMPKVRCANCKYRSFSSLTDKAIYAHLSGKDELCRDVIGIYPMLPDEKTCFLAIDFDDGDWQEDITAVRDVCEDNSIPYAVERSRSGEGGHLWIFFNEPVSAVKARKLGSGLLTNAMKKRHEIKFSSYDRMFPNQDTMPSGGFGNLIALPLQKQAVKCGNSVFVDKAFKSYHDQWAYLSALQKIDEDTVDGLIEKRRVNTLILVHTQALLQQWKAALEQFLIINEPLPEQPVKRGRKKKLSLVGQLGGSKNTLSGIVDIAVMQSLVNGDEVRPLINDYGMIIADECHHVSAVSFEAVLRAAHAKYVYGLTATPKRSDGHQPIIFMQCGPIRYSANAKEYAEKHGFKHILVPRFTKFRANINDEKLTITDVYRQLSESRYRNELIVDDVKTAVQNGRTPIIISERTAHINVLAEMLKDAADNVIILSGQGTAKAKKDLLEKVHSIPKGQSLILLATGKYAGEGFDEPRLDTLFLAMPISWSGTLSQYVGRLHREYDSKTDVKIYDYIDINVHMLDNMYKKRLRGYAALGYAPESKVGDEYKTIYTADHENDLFRDIASAEISVAAACSFISSRQLNLLINAADSCMQKGARFSFITKRSDNIYQKRLLHLLSAHSISAAVKNKLTHSFVVIDSRTVWYSSRELFSASDDNCVLRIEDEVLAWELMDSIK